MSNELVCDAQTENKTGDRHHDAGHQPWWLVSTVEGTWGDCKMQTAGKTNRPAATQRSIFQLVLQTGCTHRLLQQRDTHRFHTLKHRALQHNLALSDHRKKESNASVALCNARPFWAQHRWQIQLAATIHPTTRWQQGRRRGVADAPTAAVAHSSSSVSLSQHARPRTEVGTRELSPAGCRGSSAEHGGVVAGGNAAFHRQRFGSYCTAGSQKGTAPGWPGVATDC